MIKKGSYWFKLLSPEEQGFYVEALKNNDNADFDFLMDYWFSDFRGFISGSFTWCGTEQGHNYWSDISNSERITEWGKNGIKYSMKKIVMV